MPRTEEQFEQIRSDRKEAILDAALHVFAEEGYHGASIAKVSQRAKISKGLLYNYFISKEELLHKLIEALFDDEMKASKKYLESPLTPQKFSGYIDHIFEVIIKKPQQWKLYFSISTQPEVIAVVAKKYQKEQVQFTQVMLEFFKKQKLKNPELQLQYFFATLGGMKMQCMMNPKGFQREEMKKMIVQQFVKK